MNTLPNDTARHIARECQPQWGYWVAPIRTQEKQRMWQEMKEPITRADLIWIGALIAVGAVLGVLVFDAVLAIGQPPMVDVEQVRRVG